MVRKLNRLRWLWLPLRLAPAAWRLILERLVGIEHSSHCFAMASEPTQNADAQLVRGIGLPGLTSNIVNATIGAGIFVLPAVVAPNLGAAAPVAYVICAGAMCLFVTCFAMAGSRVSLTGGLYAYVEAAFGSLRGLSCRGALFPHGHPGHFGRGRSGCDFSWRINSSVPFPTWTRGHHFVRPAVSRSRSTFAAFGSGHAPLKPSR